MENASVYGNSFTVLNALNCFFTGDNITVVNAVGCCFLGRNVHVTHGHQIVASGSNYTQPFGCRAQCFPGCGMEVVLRNIKLFSPKEMERYSPSASTTSSHQPQPREEPRPRHTPPPRPVRAAVPGGGDGGSRYWVDTLSNDLFPTVKQIMLTQGALRLLDMARSAPPTLNAWHGSTSTTPHTIHCRRVTEEEEEEEPRVPSTSLAAYSLTPRTRRARREAEGGDAPALGVSKTTMIGRGLSKFRVRLEHPASPSRANHILMITFPPRTVTSEDTGPRDTVPHEAGYYSV